MYCSNFNVFIDMTYDLIIVSQSNGDLVEVTQNCINSARQDGAELNIIIVETGNPYKYDVDKIIEYNGVFNYNRALNLGLRYAKSDIQILANNDIVFHKGWSVIGGLMRDNKYLSASAISGNINHKTLSRGLAYEGYEVGLLLCGWCIFTMKEIWPIIGRLDERYQFWFADNAYAKQIKEKKIKHALICTVQVDHLCSKTLVKQDRSIQKRYTYSGQGIREFRNA
jgi:GT2 family glycosyltransferase